MLSVCKAFFCLVVSDPPLPPAAKKRPEDSQKNGGCPFSLFPSPRNQQFGFFPLVAPPLHLTDSEGADTEKKESETGGGTTGNSFGFGRSFFFFLPKNGKCIWEKLMDCEAVVGPNGPQKPRSPIGGASSPVRPPPLKLGRLLLLLLLLLLSLLLSLLLLLSPPFMPAYLVGSRGLLSSRGGGLCPGKDSNYFFIYILIN